MRSIRTFILILLFTVDGQGKWQYVKNFPDDNALKIVGSVGSHGLQVDPDAKVWVQLYGTTDSVLTPKGKYVKVRQIFCFNADGTPAPWNGRKIVTLPNGKIDTLWNHHRGLGKDIDGNILWTAFDVIYRIDYKTGKVLQKIVPMLNTTLCAPAVDGKGNIYVSFVVPDNPIMQFDKDGNFIGNVTMKEPYYGRTLAVSNDGLNVYSPRFSGHCVLKYSRPDLHSAFKTPPDTLFKGFDATALYWHPVSGKLWMDCGSYFDLPNRFPNFTSSYVPNTVYELDLYNQIVTDSVRWFFDASRPNDPDTRVRAVAFSMDGNTCYIATFGTDVYPPVQMFRKIAGPQSIVTFQVDMSIQEKLNKFVPGLNKLVVRGDFNGWTGDADSLRLGNTQYLYTITKDLTAQVSNEIQFKYVIQPGDTWESLDNRKHRVREGAETLPIVYFNDLSSYGSTIFHIAYEEVIRGVALNIEAEIDENYHAKDVFLHYRRGGEPSYAVVSLMLVGEKYKGSIPVNAITKRGLEYYLSVTDFSNNEAFMPEDFEQSGPYVVRVRSDSLYFPDACVAGQYHMISVPAYLDDISVANLLQDDLGVYDANTWRLYRCINNQYMEYGAVGFPGFIAGNAFWLVTKEDKQIDTGAGLSMPTNKSVIIDLQPGWNQIGNPFAFPVYWRDVGKPSSVQGLVRYTGTANEKSYEYNYAVMQPWEGYFIKNLLGNAVQIEIPAKEAMGFKKAVSNFLFDERKIGTSEWIVRLEARCGKSVDRDNYIGCLEGAANDWDELDFSEAPGIAEYVSLYFPHGDWIKYPDKYTGDFKPIQERGCFWDMEVETNVRDDVVGQDRWVTKRVKRGRRLQISQ